MAKVGLVRGEQCKAELINARGRLCEKGYVGGATTTKRFSSTRLSPQDTLDSIPVVSLR